MAQSTSAFVLTVLTGPNAGASVPLSAGRTSIGCGQDDALILDGMAPGHLSLTLDGQRARIGAGADGVAVGDAAPNVVDLPRGKAHIATLPVMVRLNDETTVNLACRSAGNGNRVSLKAAGIGGALMLLGGLLIGLQLPPGTHIAPVTPALAAISPDAARPSPVPVPVPLPAAVEAKPQKVQASPRIEQCLGDCQTAAAEMLRARMADAGLDGLTLTVDGDVLRVSGALPEGREAAWTDLRRSFETEYSRSLPLLVDTGAGPSAPSLAVSSIWLGGTPELRTKAGDVLRIGDSTKDGWTVKGIAQGRIDLVRGEQDVTVRF